MKKIKKVVDERQELELMKVERIGFWMMFYALLIAILVQSLFLGMGLKQMAGENIAFFIGAITIIVGCVRKGLWNYHSKPNMRNYLLNSLAFTLIFSIIFAAAFAVNGSKYVLVATLIWAGCIFVLMFITMLFLGEYIKRKQAKLEDKFKDK